MEMLVLPWPVERKPNATSFTRCEKRPALKPGGGALRPKRLALKANRNASDQKRLPLNTNEVGLRQRRVASRSNEDALQLERLALLTNRLACRLKRIAADIAVECFRMSPKLRDAFSISSVTHHAVFFLFRQRAPY